MSYSKEIFHPKAPFPLRNFAYKKGKNFNNGRIQAKYDVATKPHTEQRDISMTGTFSVDYISGKLSANSQWPVVLLKQVLFQIRRPLPLCNLSERYTLFIIKERDCFDSEC